MGLSYLASLNHRIIPTPVMYLSALSCPITSCRPLRPRLKKLHYNAEQIFQF